ncbi:MAG: Peptidase M16-like protein [Candidatus Daviesbacteria bacterium GW2011_GWA1_41_61]|uniref:Peptidase M16-like protein n=1 Tax=Candidatus Daviesbacteria bacterium GW2011_GWA2_40_9 TaxID=1618424 RepID=A0A0G0U2B1_9BACT|nr:MAG: processing protease [Candidatus Daviesbacteria bacterium GW2011_GWC1_40_9]KKR83229.1 MAG: Peptidase M16-like protein [Candidatus Daviesbacteria bacterium GW2011_GWA2_40_9]KKR93574.1 MAG: Peptidase M16-like protein [Candidatus Daviesbacteria bacterium GW2011_GWB1_41_15]KKS14875.1 MAG: Peptidase M16-like protein [Candidatus Daviesbacteria bacterium GW2011_GWA1_41_61]
MYKISTLKNGLTLITIDLPHLDSVTTMVAVGAGSRNEDRRIGGIAHFFEHMFFKGSRKYPTALEISTLVDGIGAINNAFTSKEFTGYWIKSASDQVELATDIISSGLSEPILAEEEITKEKGVIVEERRMYQDNPARWVYDLFFELVFGDTPMGWNIIGEEKVIQSFARRDFQDFIKSFYSPKNMALVFAGKIGDRGEELAEKYFSNLPDYQNQKPQTFKPTGQPKAKVNISYKKTDQVNIVLGGLSYDRSDPRRYAAYLLASLLGESMSSRLFTEVREKRGLAYHVSADVEDYRDSGMLAIYAGLKLEKALEGMKVILEQLERLKVESVTEEELKKVKEMQKGRMAIRSESTNYLAQFYGLQWVIDRKIETSDQYLEKLNRVSAEDLMVVAKDLFQLQKLNLQVIGPLRSAAPLEKILKT